MDLRKSIDFLIKLRDNNNREWFNDNKDFYNDAKNEFEKFIEILIPITEEIDNNINILHAKECMFRIFRDVRFSKNKSPYKTNFGAVLSKGGRKSPFAGFYVHLEPGGSFIGGGIYIPESKYLKAIRTEIYKNSAEFKKIINRKAFKNQFNEIYGEKLKLAPKGFPKEFADIDLLKNKSYAVIHNVDDSFWSSVKMVTELKKIFKVQYSFNEFLNKVIQKEV